MGIPDKPNEIKSHPILREPLNLERIAWILLFPLHINQRRQFGDTLNISNIRDHLGISHELFVIHRHEDQKYVITDLLVNNVF